MKKYVYKSPKLFAQIAIILFCIYLFANVISICSGILEYNLLHNLEEATESEIDWNDIRQVIIALFQILIYIPTFILFFIWLYRYSCNTHSLIKKPLTYTPGWTVGYFFIPIVNLFRPCQAINELCKENNKGKSSDIVGWWWATWVVSTILGKASLKLSIKAETLSQFQIANVISIISDSSDFICLSILIYLVWKMTNWQLARFREFSEQEIQEETKDDSSDNQNPEDTVCSNNNRKIDSGSVTKIICQIIGVLILLVIANIVLKIIKESRFDLQNPGILGEFTFYALMVAVAVYLIWPSKKVSRN